MSENLEMVEIAEEKNAPAKPRWVKMKLDEMEKLVVDLGKQGESPAKIGLILRDKYGVPKAKVIGKKITAILDENGISYEGEKERLDKKVGELSKHLTNNKGDHSASRALTRRLWDVYHINNA